MQDLDLRLYIELNMYNDYTYYIVVNNKLHKTTQPLRRYLIVVLKLPVQDKIFELTMGIKRIYGVITDNNHQHLDLVMVDNKNYLNVLHKKLYEPIPQQQESVQLSLEF